MRAISRDRFAVLTEEERNLGGRGEGLARSHAYKVGKAGETYQPLQSCDLIQPESGAGAGQQPGRRQEFAKNEMAQSALDPGTLRIRFNFGAGRFHQTAIGHAGRTGTFTASAREAEVDVFAVRIGDGSAGGHLHHLIDTAARRIHFHAEFAISRARVQTQTAMHALIEIGLVRFVDFAFR